MTPEIPVTIEVSSFVTKKQIELGKDVIAITITNEGNWTPIFGFNMKADDNNTIETSRSFSMGFPYTLAGNKLNIDFLSSGAGEKKFSVITYKKTC
jgi:hypothetical protein